MESNWQCLQFLNQFISPVIVIFGIVGNVLSTVVLRSRRMRSPVSVYLLGLSVCDILLLLSAGGLFLEQALAHNLCETNISNCEVYFPSYTNSTQAYSWPSIYSLAVAHLFYPLGLTAQMATIWITVCLTAERFVAGCYPLHAGLLSSIPRARSAILCCVFCAVVYNIPRWFEMSYLSLQNSQPSEDCSSSLTAHCIWHSMFRMVYYTWGYILFMFLLPVLALTVMNIKLIQALRNTDFSRGDYRSSCTCSGGSYASSLTSTRPVRTNDSTDDCSWFCCCRGDNSTTCSCHLRRTSSFCRRDPIRSNWFTERVTVNHSGPHLGQQYNTQQLRNVRTDKNVTRIVVVVVGVFIACQMPAMVYNIYFGIVSPKRLPDGWCILSEIRNFLVVVNSSINFVIYCCMGGKFRRSFIHVITPCFEKLPSGGTLPSQTNRFLTVNYVE